MWFFPIELPTKETMFTCDNWDKICTSWYSCFAVSVRLHWWLFVLNVFNATNTPRHTPRYTSAIIPRPMWLNTCISFKAIWYVRTLMSSTLKLMDRSNLKLPILPMFRILKLLARPVRRLLRPDANGAASNSSRYDSCTFDFDSWLDSSELMLFSVSRKSSLSLIEFFRWIILVSWQSICFDNTLVTLADLRGFIGVCRFLCCVCFFFRMVWNILPIRANIVDPYVHRRGFSFSFGVMCVMCYVAPSGFLF